MRVDRPDPADEPDNAGMAENARPPDKPDATGSGLEKEASSEGVSGSPPAIPGAALRIERNLAHRAKVEAVYRQHDLEQGNGAVKEPKCETVTFAIRHVEADDPHRHLTGSGRRPSEEARLTEPDGGNALPARSKSS